RHVEPALQVVHRLDHLAEQRLVDRDPLSARASGERQRRRHVAALQALRQQVAQRQVEMVAPRRQARADLERPPVDALQFPGPRIVAMTTVAAGVPRHAGDLQDPSPSPWIPAEEAAGAPYSGAGYPETMTLGPSVPGTVLITGASSG